MTWIFWRKVFREERAMFVCSVFFLFLCSIFIFTNVYYQVYSKQRMISDVPRITTVNVVLSMFALFLHKTTWREYFDAREVREEERCLCAPFFSSFSSYCSSSSQPTSWKLGHLLFFLLKNECYHHLKLKKQGKLFKS